jgi:hemerythrin-like domain-containing protein
MHQLFEDLKKEHERVKEILKELSNTDSEAGEERTDLLAQLKKELVPHSRAEEVVLYDCLRDADRPIEVLGLEGYIEHGLVDKLMESLEEGEPETADWEAQFAVLKENLHHHIEEEEDEIFKKAEKLLSPEDLDVMVEQYHTLKEEFMETLPSQEEAVAEEPDGHHSIPRPSFLA